jgi:F-type H+-transporting ATPase subunit b
MFINEEIFIVLTKNTKGGLFDIGATLPLVALQFLILMFILNVILYKPLISIIDKRDENIFNNLSKASEILLTASNMTNKYEESLNLTKKESKQSITELEKLQKEKFDKELQISQKAIEILIQKILKKFAAEKENILNKDNKIINNQILLLSQQITKKLF